MLLLLTGCLLLAPPPEAVQRFLDPGDALHVATGAENACAIFEEGNVLCSDPAFQPPGDEFVLLDADGGWCGLTEDEDILCFGGFPDPPSGAHSRLALGGYAACAVDADGLLVCWGADDGRAEPPGDPGWKQVAVGDEAACALRNSGSADCWGDSGVDAVEDRPAGERFEGIAVSKGAVCAISAETEELVCWGDDDGEGLLDPPNGQFTAVTGGSSHFCALDDDGEAVCWGEDTDGQSSPPDGNFVQIDAGRRSTCAVRENGFVACWGGAEGVSFRNDP